MSQILRKHFLSYSQLGDVAQKGYVVDKLSDAAYLIQVTDQANDPDVRYFRIASINEMATWRLYEHGYQRDVAADEIHAAYEKRVAEAEAQAAADKAAAEKALENNAIPPESN